MKNMYLDFNFEKLKEQSLPRSPVTQNQNKTSSETLQNKLDSPDKITKLG